MWSNTNCWHHIVVNRIVLLLLLLLLILQKLKVNSILSCSFGVRINYLLIAGFLMYQPVAMVMPDAFENAEAVVMKGTINFNRKSMRTTTLKLYANSMHRNVLQKE